MSETVTVLHVVNDTVIEETWQGERITFQHFADCRAQLRIWRGQRIVQYVAYARAERIHRTIDREDA